MALDANVVLELEPGVSLKEVEWFFTLEYDE